MTVSPTCCTRSARERNDTGWRTSSRMGPPTAAVQQTGYSRALSRVDFTFTAATGMNNKITSRNHCPGTNGRFLFTHVVTIGRVPGAKAGFLHFPDHGVRSLPDYQSLKRKRQSKKAAQSVLKQTTISWCRRSSLLPTEHLMSAATAQQLLGVCSAPARAFRLRRTVFDRVLVETAVALCGRIT